MWWPRRPHCLSLEPGWWHPGHLCSRAAPHRGLHTCTLCSTAWRSPLWGDDTPLPP